MSYSSIFRLREDIDALVSILTLFGDEEEEEEEDTQLCTEKRWKGSQTGV